jgi:hypothetical protein
VQAFGTPSPVQRFALQEITAHLIRDVNG